MVIWLIGKSGSGKTFFAKKILSKIKKRKFILMGMKLEKNFLKIN